MNTIEQGWSELTEALLKTQDKKIFQQYLELFLTAEERDDLATRFLITKELLLQRKTQREMAKDLKVSIAKITRGSNALKRTHPKFLAELKKQFV
jgi:TrpR family trp operon transcriptional repressor